ncbi:unnamed protein product [Prorocentrum cordatum]|uniref:Uncharacterized protein n=1 Tax=Prorocentrum cordatum TaxID=2364126 RepID=A0ABN9V4B2_9DINO|nr:unnamed protein product [Polarella glacialis]
MPLLWICAVPEQSQRLRCSSKKNGVRMRLRLPDGGALAAKLSNAGAPAVSATGRLAKEYSIVGIVDAVPGDVCGSPLEGSPGAQSVQEVRIWQEYYNFPLDGYTVLARRAFKFEKPLQVSAFYPSLGSDPVDMDHNKNSGAPFLPFLYVDGDVGSLRGHVNGELSSQSSLSEALVEWGFEDVSWENILASVVVEPISWMILHRKWCSMLWLGRWRIPIDVFPDFPPGDWTQARANKHDQCIGEGFPRLDADMFDSLLEALQRWRPIIRSAVDEDDFAEEDLIMYTAARFCRQMSLVLRRSSQPRGGHAQYSSKAIISSIFFERMLGSHMHIKDAIPSAMSTIFPNSGLSELSRRAAYPKASTISSSHVALDMAYMAMRPLRCPGGPMPHPVYAWADSSPQSGRNWFMMMERSGEMDQILDAAIASESLARSRPDWDDHEEAEEADLGEFSTHHQALEVALRTHACVPVALGSGKTGLEDKIAAKLHADIMEMRSLENVRDHLSATVSWTTDLGTEISMPTFRSLDWRKLLPEWRLAGLLSADTGCDDDATDDVIQSVADLMARTEIHCSQPSKRVRGVPTRTRATNASPRNRNVFGPGFLESAKWRGPSGRHMCSHGVSFLGVRVHVRARWPSAYMSPVRGCRMPPV